MIFFSYLLGAFSDRRLSVSADLRQAVGSERVLIPVPGSEKPVPLSWLCGSLALVEVPQGPLVGSNGQGGILPIADSRW